MKQAYSFYQDRKITCWERSHFEIRATSYEEALAIIKSWGGEDMALWEDEDSIIFKDCTTLYDTSESLSPEENYGQATIEVFNMSGETIADNSRQG